MISFANRLVDNCSRIMYYTVMCTHFIFLQHAMVLLAPLYPYGIFDRC